MVLGSQLWAVKPWQLGTVPLTSVSPELRPLLGTSVGSLPFVRVIKESVPPYKGNRKAPSHTARGTGVSQSRSLLLRLRPLSTLLYLEYQLLVQILFRLSVFQDGKKEDGLFSDLPSIPTFVSFPMNRAPNHHMWSQEVQEASCLVSPW